MKKSKWIWYYGDFEIFHSAKLHSLRQEHGTTFPGFWSLANTYPIVRFSKTVNTRADDTITLYLNGVDQSFGYTWDAEGFAVYVASQYYDEYKTQMQAIGNDASSKREYCSSLIPQISRLPRIKQNFLI